MPVSRKRAASILDRILHGAQVGERLTRLKPRLPSEAPLPARVPAGNDHTEAGLQRRRAALAGQGIALDRLAGAGAELPPAALAANIENFVGFARVPVGLIGPLRINGANAHGDFFVPMATTEGALVASYHRGAYVISQSGGASAVCLTETVSRAPCFLFRSLAEAGLFLSWVLSRFDSFQDIVGGTSRHCRLVDLRTSLMGKDVYLGFEYETGDAAGQNMVTIATEAICRHLVAHAPVQPAHWYLEGNLSGDKKATMVAFTYARGKKVVAEVAVQRRVLKRIIHAEPEDLVRYWQISLVGGAQSGSIGVHGHFANALAAVFIACGQDAACVAEASVGLTRMDVTAEGDLYVCVSLPNMIVGTVGGGTHLPTARECLEIMDCYGADRARKFAEICAAAALAGEISIIGALSAGEFGAAHARYGRKK
ncbi:MAG: hydroxymethylglutaryl-CoA reductase [Kiritimatiellae bacterium]|nr:hydroxymethylglutaryl-CoA reductase [Kiritimatiellia bacterium]